MSAKTGGWVDDDAKVDTYRMISILTLNLRFGLAPDGPNGWEFRKKSLADFLGRYSADFAGFQEANEFQITFIDAALKDSRYIGRWTDAPERWQSNLIFYHKDWHCIHRDHFFLSDTPDVRSSLPDSKWPRQCTVGMFEKKGVRVICINTHFDFAPAVQAESARIILQRIRSLPPEVPVILFGDFNAEPDSSCRRVFTGDDPNRPDKARQFKDAFRPPYPATFHGFTGKTDGVHIDWMLFNGPVTPATCTVVQQEFAGRYPSDHFPLFATFEI